MLCCAVQTVKLVDGTYMLPFSRENLFELLLAIPAIIVLIGLWGLLCPLCCCCRGKPSWQKVPVSWMTGLTCIQLPFIFLFTGLFFFPMVIFMGDACASYGGLIKQGVSNNRGSSAIKSLCTTLGDGNSELCEFKTTKYDLNIDTTFSPEQWLYTILQGCPEGERMLCDVAVTVTVANTTPLP